ncbi:MAG: ATP-binding protein, partial [Candidatus Methanomethylophilaceae archaeon]|nr:ATP-binding protein [Candidatus Methanomethylophilaceae archaeon]
MTFQDEDITLAWEDILSDNENHLKLVNIQSEYPEKKSLFITFSDIERHNEEFAFYLLENPDKSLAIGKRVMKGLLPATWDPDHDINLRVTELPKDAKVEISNLRAKHLGRLIAVEGMVRKATPPRPRLSCGLYICEKCNAQVRVPQSGTIQKEPLLCPNEGCNKSAPRFVLDEKNSEYIDTQKVEIQENPEGLRGGKQPERLFGYIEDDIAGNVTPGNRVTLNGIVRSVQKTDRDKSTIFEIFIDVMSVESEQSDFSELDITDEDEQEILRMSKDPNLRENIVKSIAPTIFGMDEEKEAVALQLFGGTHKIMDDGTSIRGDIHILMIGDPGVAKSQILRFMAGLSPRGIYASGKSASAAGLCVHGDTVLDLENGSVKIADYVNAHMTAPEEYRPGIWRQEVSGDRIEAPSDLGSLRLLPITYVWRIKTPERLIRITADGDDRLVLTPETKMQAMHGGRFDWTAAQDIAPGDMVSVVKENMRMLAVESVESLTEDLPEFVYDLTVDPAHAFVGSGFIVHNTAAAVKDDFGDGRWTLEAGALVLADKGLACIDELDKMTPQDRSSLHEAMESQRISIAKAGITAVLQCRCSLLAAANPKNGRFDAEVKIADQIDLPPALMSRFDLMFVLRDLPDKRRDKDISSHILNSHMRGQALVNKEKGKGDDYDVERTMSKTDSMKPPYQPEMIRKYVAYAKKNCFPIFTQEAYDTIQNDYLNIRNMGEDGSIPIPARQLEACVRLSEASAKMHLRDSVTEEDAQTAVRLIDYYLDRIARSGAGFDIDMAGGEVTHKDRKDDKVVKEVIRRYTSTGGVTIDVIIEETGLDK